MPHKGHSGRHRSNRSNPTIQGHFQSFDWYLHKIFLVLLYFDKFASARSEFCKEEAWGHHGGSSKLMFSKCQFLVREGVLIFWGIPHGVPVNSEYSQELCRTMNDVGLCGHLPHFLPYEIWPPNIELSFYQVHCLCQNLSCIAAVSEELILRQSTPRWFYRLLRSIASSWIHIDVKRISQACRLHHLKDIETKIVKHNFGMKNKIWRFLLLDGEYLYNAKVLSESCYCVNSKNLT